jgi:hypothetical protein
VLPFCVTEVLEGEDITAFVVGTSVVSVSADGRLKETVPVDVERHCAEIAMTLELRFCAIDITGTPVGDWYCRGRDCLPDIHWCSDESALAVASRLGGLLMGEAGTSIAVAEGDDPMADKPKEPFIRAEDRPDLTIDLAECFRSIRLS